MSYNALKLKIKYHKTLGLLLGLVAVLTGSAIPLPVFADSATQKAKPSAAERCELGVVESGIVQSESESGGFDLNYRIEGNGMPMMVLGFPNFYARTFSEKLRSHLCLVFVDHRVSAVPPKGFDPKKDFTLQRLVDDVELIRKTIGLGQVVVLGHSGQAFLALEYAKQYTNKVSRVVMVGFPELNISDPKGSDSEGKAQDSAPEDKAQELVVDMLPNWTFASLGRKAVQADIKINQLPVEEQANLSDSEKYVYEHYILEAPKVWYDPRFDAWPLWKGVYVNGKMVDHVWGDIFAKMVLSKLLQGIKKKPVAAMMGAYDFWAPPINSWEPLTDEHKNFTVRFFEKSGHVPQLEQPEEFDRALLTWLGVL